MDYTKYDDNALCLLAHLLGAKIDAMAFDRNPENETYQTLMRDNFLDITDKLAARHADDENWLADNVKCPEYL